MSASRIVQIIVTGNVDQAVRELEKLTGSVELSSRSMHDNISKIGGLALAGLAVGFGAAGVAGIKMASDFDAAMEQIHTQAGASQAEVEKMKSAVLDLAGPLGTSPDELAAGLYHIESTGLRGAAALKELKIAAEGAKVGNADLEDVTNALNAAVVSHIPGVENMSKAMGALNAVVGSGDMRMQDLADALGSGMLAVVKGFGLSLNDVGAALATFGDNNIRGADAATLLRTAVTYMAAGSKTGAKALGELGITQGQLADDMKTGGLNKAVTDLHDHLVTAGNEGKNTGELLVQAFGKKAGPGIAILTGQFDRFESKVKEVGDGAGKFGDAWKGTQDTFKFKVDQMTATVQALGIKLGEFLIPIVEDLAQALSDVVDWLEKHKAVAIALAGVITTVLGAAIAVFVYDKIAAFVAGIQRMLTGLGLLKTQAEETAAAVETSGATMAESTAAGGAAAAAGGGEAAGAEAGAIGEGAAAGGAGLTAFAVGAALVVGVGAGLARTFGIVDDETVTLKFNLGSLANESVPQLSDKFTNLTNNARQMNRVLDDNKASTLATKTMHQEFNQVLDQSPQFAQKFISAVQQSGQSTTWYSQKLQEHVIASEEARVAQERFAIQAEITDAKARGDAAAVESLTAQLDALPTDKQIQVTVHQEEAYLNAIAVKEAIDAIPRYVDVAVNMTGNLAASGISSIPT